MNKYKIILLVLCVLGGLMLWQWSRPAAVVANSAAVERVTDLGLLFANENTTLTQTLHEYIDFMLNEFDVDLRIYTTNEQDDINLHAFTLFESRGWVISVTARKACCWW